VYVCLALRNACAAPLGVLLISVSGGTPVLYLVNFRFFFSEHHDEHSTHRLDSISALLWGSKVLKDHINLK